jgi:UDP-glucose 4-epimerase
VSRVLITGGASAIGAAVARRLLADPAYDVRVSDGRSAPQWMREGCEIHSTDLRVPAHAQAAVEGCAHVIHLAACSDQLAGGHTLLEYEGALHSAVLRAALDGHVERFVYVSSALVLERARLFPTPESHLTDCPAPRSARGFARLSGERLCRAAHDQHGLPFTICRPSSAYGAGAAAGEQAVDNTVIDVLEAAHAGTLAHELPAPSERTLTPTHVDDVARALVVALDAPAALNEDFNVAGARELGIAEIASIVWEACGRDADELGTASIQLGNGTPLRSWPAAEKARELLGWQPRIDFAEGVAEALSSLREPSASRIGSAL